jgi:hypothetical protein
MPGYLTDTDIANRACQLCRIAGITRFNMQSSASIELGFAYDKMRQAELRDNLWVFATRRAVLRPVDTVTAVLETSAQTLSGVTLPFTDTTGVIVGQLVTGTNIAANATVLSFVANTSVTLSIAISGTVASGAAITFGSLTVLWTPPAWATGTTYANGHVATYLGEWWQSKVAGNVGNTPSIGIYWRRYSGPDSLQAWDDETSYYSGELALGTDGTVYLSLVTTNLNHDPTATTGFWLAVNGTVAGLSILYPIGTGPWTDTNTSNVFRKPRGFLRKAPSDPMGDMGQSLGVPTGPSRDDWIFEGDYIVSSAHSPILLRYVSDFIDVPDMDSIFVEMLAARLAKAVAPQLAPPDTLQVILGETARNYQESRKQAILINGIEVGSIAAPIDPYITCRW